METSDLINPCESSLYMTAMMIARTFENKNHIKIKITRHRFMKNGCIWEGTLLMNACWTSVLSSFTCSPVMVCLKKMFTGEITWNLERRLERLCHYVIFVLFERGAKYCCVAILWNGTNWKFIFLWRKINWYGLEIAKCHFSYTIWLMISEKSIMVYKILHHVDAPMYQESHKTRHTEKIVY